LGDKGEGVYRDTGEPPRDIRIGVISTPLIPTPPRGYGGIELLVAELVKNLEEIGFKVRLYASSKSMSPSLGLSAGFTEEELAKKALHDMHEGMLDVIVDWSHMKIYSRFDDRVLSQVFWTDVEGKNPVYPSRAVARAFGNSSGTVIYPGIDISKYRLGKEREDWFIFLSRIIPEKGVEKTIAIAKMANIRLKVVGHTGRFANQQYVEKIKSMCTGKIEWVGEVSEKEKIDLLSHARGLIYKNVWLESFGIFTVEALASGCPCIVSIDSGGPAEIVIHNKTGYICSTIKEYCSAISRIEEIEPEECRKRAEYFSSARMARDWAKHILSFMEKAGGGYG